MTYFKNWKSKSYKEKDKLLENFKKSIEMHEHDEEALKVAAKTS